jgi:Fe-S oxidoreductase
VFRDELQNLFPENEDARRLARQCVLLSELLAQDEAYRPPRLARHALMHAHCHHKAVMGTEAEQTLLARMGLETEAPQTGCCGLAGSFGYETGHYDVSMKIGEHALLPAVRKAAKDALIIADGFSCRTQIEHGSGRKALHLAEVLQMALHDGEEGPPGDYPERGYAQPAAAVSPTAAGAAIAITTAAAALLVFGLRAAKR